MIAPLQRGIRFVRREPILCIAALCALGSMAAVPPSAAYGGYIDLRVLALLWCLMAVVAGFRECGCFEVLTHRLLTANRGDGRTLSVLLVLLPFFLSMAVTNDVALLTFVPFTLALLDRLGRPSAAIWLLVLQTLAANLGSMATPVGNPQNLYLYAYYGLSAGEFFSALLPLTALSGLALAAAALPILPRSLPIPQLTPPKSPAPRQLARYLALFALCLLSVFRLLPWQGLTVIVLVTLFWTDRAILRQPDYTLLVTFVCFFVFSGNLGQLDAVRSVLGALLRRSTLLTAVLASQVISNVPAAVLLSGFTDQWRALLVGVDIGGLGTPVASLASLITLKLYLVRPDAHPLRFLLAFTAANLAGLVLLLGAAALLK